jgi:hypothetical protein
MESAWLRLGSGPRPGSRRSVWVFLATGRFAAKTPSHERWIVLDFLGFSRSNRDFSIDYGPLSGEKSIARFSRGVRGAGTGACGRRHAEAQDCSWGKLTLVSDFQQLIVVRAVPFRPPQSRTTRSKGELPPNPFRFSSTAAKRFFGAAKKQRSSIELQGVRRLISGRRSGFRSLLLRPPRHGRGKPDRTLHPRGCRAAAAVVPRLARVANSASSWLGFECLRTGRIAVSSSERRRFPALIRVIRDAHPAARRFSSSVAEYRIIKKST